MKKSKLAKQILGTVLVLTLVLSLVACSSSKKNGANTDTANNSITEEISKETSDAATVTEEQTETNASTSNVEWKQFLKEYEGWVDDYIELTKKYKDNPSDVSILSDYTDMMNKLTDWTTKTENMKKELEDASPAELVEYSSELARIAEKLAQAVN